MTTLEMTAAADQTIDDVIELDEIQLRVDEITEPDVFLDTNRGAAWLAPMLSGAYYTQWFNDQRSPYGLKHCNALANDIIDAKRTGVHPETALESHFSGGEGPGDVYESDHADDVRARIERIAEDLEEHDENLPALDVDAWAEAVRERIIDHMTDNDTSSVLDMYGSYDRCEIVLRLNKHGEMVACESAGPDFTKMVVCDAFADALSKLGHRVSDYRHATGNRSKSQLRRRSRPTSSRQLCSMTDLAYIVENACSSNFEIVLYAVVPVLDVVTVDLTRPLLLERYAVAAWDSLNGAFFDKVYDEALLIAPGTMTLAAVHGSSPAADICGMYTTDYQTRLRNPGGKDAR